MIDTKAKKVLLINLSEASFEVKSFADLNSFIGGVGLGLKLYETYKEDNPLIFSIGPLSGFFPFVSKTCVLVNNDGVIEDTYIGGGLSLRMRFAGLDAIVLYGKSEEETILDIQNSQVSFLASQEQISDLGLPGKKSVLSFENDKIVLDGYFTTPQDFLEKNLREKNVEGIVVTGTEIFNPENFSEYEKVYNEILSRSDEMSVEKGNYPSCSNCPMGCGKSKVGEIGGNVLIHSLVGCQFADKIYTDIGIVFSCLNVLGYEYTHEDIENLPELIEKTLKNLS
ncbi:aldehyde ferredoxin oxidoreductase N-terminal domain-containing protein [Patescibacteria group bacterium]